MLETEASILGTWCTTWGTANSVAILPRIEACKNWQEFLTNPGSCVTVHTEWYFLVLQLGTQRFCMMGNQSCLCDFRTQVLFLDLICVPGGSPTKGSGPLCTYPQMQILRTPAELQQPWWLMLFCLLQMKSLISPVLGGSQSLCGDVPWPACSVEADVTAFLEQFLLM